MVTSSTAGEVAPEKRATVRAEMGARVAAVKARRGDRAHRGALVIALDDGDLAARLQQARAALPALLAQIDQAKARVATRGRIEQGNARGCSTPDPCPAVFEKREDIIGALFGARAPRVSPRPIEPEAHQARYRSIGIQFTARCGSPGVGVFFGEV